MAEIATIARPYAEALFKVVKPQAAQAVEWLDALAVVAALAVVTALAVRGVF